MELERFKQEIKDDLDDYMDEFDTQSLVTIPEDVVDLEINE